MLALALSAVAVGLAISQPTNSEQDIDTNESYRDIDDAMYGRIREENYNFGNNWTSESSRIVRPVTGVTNPVASAKVWTDYHRKHNQALQDLYVKNQIADNQRILRTNVDCPQRIPNLPDGSFSAFRSVPNAYFDYQEPPKSDYRLDNDYSKFDDQVGQSGGMPVHGIEYIWNPAEFFGNPWGPAGQLYDSLRTKTNYPSAYGDIPESYKKQKTVSFGGVSVF